MTPDWTICHNEMLAIRNQLETLMLKLAAFKPLALGLTVYDDESKVRFIKQAVADIFGFQVVMLDAKNRQERYAWPRHIAMSLSRECTDLSLESIGEMFGGRDHGTVLHAIRHVEDRVETEPKTKVLLGSIKIQLEEKLKQQEAA